MQPRLMRNGLVVILVALLSSVACADGPSGDADERLVRTLKAFEPVPKPVVTWSPLAPRVAGNFELYSELTRVFRVASLNFRWSRLEFVQQAVGLDPEWVAFTFSPYHDRARFPDNVDSFDWSADEVCGPITAKHVAYFGWVLRRAQEIRPIVDGRKVMVMLDYERGCRDSLAVGDRLNIVHGILESELGAEVFYYNDGQHSPGPGTKAHIPRRASPVPANTRGRYASFSAYYGVYSAYTQYVARATAEANPERDLVAFVSIGGVYERRPYTPRGFNKRSSDVTAPQQYGEAWQTGWLCCNPFPANFPEAYGPWGRVAVIFWWPPALRMGDDGHLIEFIRGAHGLRHKPL